MSMIRSNYKQCFIKSAAHFFCPGFDILKKLFEQIQTIEFKKFAHINIDEIAPVDTNGIDISVMKETFTFSIILYPNSFDALDGLFGDIREQAKKAMWYCLPTENPMRNCYLGCKKR